MRYDKLARNFLAAVVLAATVCYWVRVLSLEGGDDEVSDRLFDMQRRAGHGL
jgi:hypothetical protein